MYSLSKVARSPFIVAQALIVAEASDGTHEVIKVEKKTYLNQTKASLTNILFVVYLKAG